MIVRKQNLFFELLLLLLKTISKIEFEIPRNTVAKSGEKLFVQTVNYVY